MSAHNRISGVVHIHLFYCVFRDATCKHFQIFNFFSQGDKKHFNRGGLFNVGFAEISKKRIYDCIVLHDVDNYPEDTRNLYMCDNRAIHLVSKQRYVRKDYREYAAYSVFKKYFGRHKACL